MFDAHNHLQFAEFDADRAEVLTRAMHAGVSAMVIAGYDSERRALAAEIAQRQGVGATAGLHPWAVNRATAEEELNALDRVDWSLFCGVGELGLDFVRATSATDRALQVEVVRRQLALARSRDLPVVFHCVKANDELAKLLKQDGLPARGGMVHSFWGSEQQAHRFAELGLHLSIGTQITHSPSKKMSAAIRSVGLEQLLVETDAPSRPPAGVRSERNEPAYLPCVVEAVALVLGTTIEAVATTTERNARQLFDLRETLVLSEQER